MTDHIRVYHDADDTADVVIVELYDPHDHADAPPCAEMQMSDDDAYLLEKGLHKERLNGLGLAEHLVMVDDVQVGDIIGDLGFTVTKVDRLTARGQRVLIWSGHDQIWMQGGREIVVNRAVPSAIVEQAQPPKETAEVAIDLLTEVEKLILQYAMDQAPMARDGSDTARREIANCRRELETLMRKHMDDLNVVAARRVLLAVEKISAAVNG